MTFKSILVHVDDSPRASTRFDAAARLAQSCNARLTGLVSTGTERFLADAVVADANDPAMATYLNTLRQRAKKGLDEFERVAATFGLKDVQPRQTDADPVASLAALGAYSDLCIVGHYGQRLRPDGQRKQMAADVASTSGCPVLLLPDGVAPSVPFRRLLLGWNGSAEASRALHFAMPLLLGGADVSVAILGDAVEAGTDLSPAAEIASAMRRHGIDATILQRRDVRDAGHALLELAAEHKSDLIVMGCYGHARVRELLLGGATKSVLMSDQIPVFMST